MSDRADSRHSQPSQLQIGLRPRAAVERMGEYHPPLAGRDGLRLDFNENTLAPSPKVAQALHRVAAEGLTRYPEREPAEVLAARHFGLDKNQVLLTNGVDEAIHLVCEAFLEPEHEALIVTPTFSMYRLYAEATGAAVIEIQMDEHFAFPLDRLLAAITSNTRLIAIASPNNPTGSTAGRDVILTLALAAPQAALLVDEAYYHFYGSTVLDQVSAHPNLFVARTFSKAYGLAGLRIGLLAGHRDAMRFVRKVSSPYNVNSVALECLPAALEDEEYIHWYAQEIITQRRKLEQLLDSWGVPRWPSEANFVLMKIGAKHAQFTAAMRSRGILVRDRHRDPGCAGCVRITLGVAEQMQRATPALRASLDEIGWTSAEVQAEVQAEGQADAQAEGKQP